MGNMLPCSYKGFGSGRCEGKENLRHHVFAVVQFVETLHYKPEGHGFYSPWGNWDFS
jgi:hypothetical protein